MTNSIKISPQRTSFILSVSVILYWATDSYLYLSCHINLMEYSTPAILYITAMILACGVLQRFFSDSLQRMNWVCLLASK